PFRVESVDRAALEGGHRALEETAFVERACVQRRLHVERVADLETAVDGCRRRAPILVQLETTGAGTDHFFECSRLAGIALAENAEVHREGFERLQHAADVPGAGARGGERAVGWTRA